MSHGRRTEPDKHEMEQDEYIQLSDSCNFLEHYHLEHTQDKITRFRGKAKSNVDRRSCDIIVVSDPIWKAKLREFLKPELPE
jgi:hypothetical protein